MPCDRRRGRAFRRGEGARLEAHLALGAHAAAPARARRGGRAALSRVVDPRAPSLSPRMSPIVFLPGFDGAASLRREFVDSLGARHAVRAVTYPNRTLGSLDGYRDHAMSVAPVDWKPILVAESFSGLVAARWAAIDARVQAVVLCGAFARNPVGHAASLGAMLPALVKLGPAFMAPVAWASADKRRSDW